MDGCAYVSVGCVCVYAYMDILSINVCIHLDPVILPLGLYHVSK